MDSKTEEMKKGGKEGGIADMFDTIKDGADEMKESGKDMLANATETVDPNATGGKRQSKRQSKKQSKKHGGKRQSKSKRQSRKQSKRQTYGGKRQSKK